jgi:glycosyltransferase involved in cell wall biosynthesis
MIQQSLISAASFNPNLLHSPSAWLGHLPFAGWIIQEVNPKIFVELGTHYGHSYFSFCQSVAEASLSTKCYAVDTWQGDEHAGVYSDEIYSKVSAHNQEHYAGFSRLLRMTFDDAVTCFADESIELLHIDGFHTYEAVKHDFVSWLPKLAPGAVVMFHDTNVRERNFGVWKLWGELQVSYPNNLEFIHSHGLGVLQLNNAPVDKKLKWLQLSSSENQRLINYFAALGSRQLDRFEFGVLKQHATSLTQVVAERDGQIINLNQALSDRDGQIVGFKQELSDRDGQIVGFKLALSDRDGQIVGLNQALSDRDGQIEALRNSTSWKITRPLRVVAHQMKRIRLVARLTIPAIARGGGLKNTIKKAIQLYRREGMAGIRRGFGIVATSGQNNLSLSSHEFDRNDYAEWIRRYDTLTDKSRATLRERVDAFAQKPLISVVMPVYPTPLKLLEDAIRSVQSQIYPNWELCIAEDASTDVGVNKLLRRYAENDSRIKVALGDNSSHISAASNSALDMVNGEYIALLDSDDLLSEQALFWIADAINTNPDAGLIYSDEDKINQSGRRYDPYFKPDWNLDLFLSRNMIGHLGAYRTDMVRKLGGFRVGYEGAQDYDLALRCTEQLAPQQIVHIPRVLYHWRRHPGSTAQARNEKNCSHLAGERALNDHFGRVNVSAKVELLDFGMYRVRYAVPVPAPLVSLIIPTHNGLELIKQCIESILFKTTYKNYEILVVDNNSDDPNILAYFASLAEDSRIQIIRDERTFNYSALNNAAVQRARGEYLGLINNDIKVISPDWLDEMIGLATQPGVGAVGARLWYPNDTLQHGGCITGLGEVAGHFHKQLPRGHLGYFARAQLTQTLSAVTAACLVIKKSIYQELGGLNETDLKVAYNDIDFCLRVREAGYRNVWTPFAELYHYESATRGYEDTPEKQLRLRNEVLYMQKRWGNSLKNDPAYNANLTLDREDVSYAWPPRVI